MKVMYDVNTNSPSTPQQTLSQENKSQHLSNDRIDTTKSTNTGIYSFHVVNPLPNTFLDIYSTLHKPNPTPTQQRLSSCEETEYKLTTDGRMRIQHGFPSLNATSGGGKN